MQQNIKAEFCGQKLDKKIWLFMLLLGQLNKYKDCAYNETERSKLSTENKNKQ